MAGTSNLASCLAFPPGHEQLVALLLSLCTGAGSPFVHRADVVSATPADLVGNLRPAHGTDKGDGHGGVWYFLSPKKCKGGRRVRLVAGAGGERWHEERGREKIDAVLDDGRPIVGFFRTFSYAYRTPEKKFKRPGWCMFEYELEDARYDHVLCKVYSIPRAKASASTSAVLPSSGSKRKVDGDHPEVAPAVKLSAPRQVLKPGLVHDAHVPMMPVQSKLDVDRQSFGLQLQEEGLQPGNGLNVAASVHQHNAGAQAEGPQPGAGPVLGGIDHTGFLSDEFFVQYVEELNCSMEYDHFFNDLPPLGPN